MKAKVFYVWMFIMLVASILGSSSKLREKPVDVLFLENVEALASGEYGSHIYCIDFGTLDCPLNGTKVKYIIEEYNMNDL